MSATVDPSAYSGDSRTKQSFREEVDINVIVRRGRQGAVNAHLAKGMPRYMDVSEVGDYKGALDMLRSMDAYFGKLPAKVRAAFDNDPSLFLDSVETTDGRAKLEELGVIPKVPVSVAVPQPRNADGTFAEAKVP